jgi:hypothetical protein
MIVVDKHMNEPEFADLMAGILRICWMATGKRIHAAICPMHNQSNEGVIMAQKYSREQIRERLYAQNKAGHPGGCSVREPV